MTGSSDAVHGRGFSALARKPDSSAPVVLPHWQILSFKIGGLWELSGASEEFRPTIHAVEKSRPCRQATKRRILTALGVPWELRYEYFPRARSVRPVEVEEVRSA